MTVWCEGSPQNKELKKGFIPDAQRLCERTGLEPGRVDAPYPLERKKSKSCDSDFGADYGARTRHLHLGKVALYQMS